MICTRETIIKLYDDDVEDIDLIEMTGQKLKIASIQDNAFSGMINLEEINLENNSISEIKETFSVSLISSISAITFGSNKTYFVFSL